MVTVSHENIVGWTNITKEATDRTHTVLRLIPIFQGGKGLCRKVVQGIPTSEDGNKRVGNIWNNNINTRQGNDGLVDEKVVLQDVLLMSVQRLSLIYYRVSGTRIQAVKILQDIKEKEIEAKDPKAMKNDVSRQVVSSIEGRLRRRKGDL